MTVLDVTIPDLGMDTDTVSHLVNKRKAPLIQNFLMDRPGILPMRGPLAETTTWNNGASIGLFGNWVHNDKVLISKLTSSALATRDYWVAPYRRATAANQLRIGTLSSFIADLETDVVSGAMVGAISPGIRGAPSGNYVYGPEGYTGTTITQDGYVYQDRWIVVWDVGAGTVFGLLNSPHAAQDAKVHYQRLFVLGGVAVGGTRIEFNSLYWSDPLPAAASLPDVAGSWQDDVSGLVNRIVIGAETPLDFGVALAHVGENLLILKRHSMWMLYGTSPSNFVVKQVDNEVGCIDPRSVVEYNGGVYFMSERGFMFYDGSRVVSASAGLTSSLNANALKQVGSRGVDGGYCRATLLGDGYILVTTGSVGSVSLTTAADTAAWLFYAPTGAWSQFTSGAVPWVVTGGRTVNHSWMMSDQKLFKANYLFRPDAAPFARRGYDSIDNNVTRFVIPSRWTTRALALAAPMSRAQVQRVMLEYYWNLASGGWRANAITRPDSLNGGFTVTKTKLFGVAQTLASDSATRGSFSPLTETDELYLDVTAELSSAVTFSQAELHRLIVEYSPGQRIDGSQ